MRNWKKVLKIILLAAAVVVLLLLAYKFKYAYKQNYRQLIHYINSFGDFAVLIYILIFTLRTLLIVFPFSIMVVLGGGVFGPFRGFIYSVIAVFISATMAYYISKFLGKEFVQKLLRGKVKELDTKVEEHGFKIILLMRISALFPYDILNFAAGLTKVKYRDFILGTMLGILPETFSLTYLGHNLKNPFSPKFLAAVGLMILTIAVPLIFSKMKKKQDS